MNDIENLIKSRHAVRAYKDAPIEQAKVDELSNMIAKIRQENHVHFELVLDNSKTFEKFAPHFENAYPKNYFVLIGDKNDKNSDEKLGYFGEQLVLKATELGLNTCWITGTFSKRNVPVEIDQDEKIRGVIALGYGKNPGVPHKSKTLDEVSRTKNAPEWFKQGVEFALLAPTAMNEQKFKFELQSGDVVKATPGRGLGGFTKMDLGIAKYHFELGAGDHHFTWTNN